MKEFLVGKEDADQRFDRILRKLFPALPLGSIYKYIRSGKYKLNTKKATIKTRVEEGDTIQIHASEQQIHDWSQKKKMDPVSQKLETKRILHEDEHILVYDKPAGLVVHPTDHKTDEVSLIQQIHDYLKSSENTSLTFLPTLAHRIDRETSGIIITAKSKKALESLTEQFRKRQVQKEYLAITWRVPEEKSGTIDSPLMRVEQDKKNKPKIIVDPKGQSARTDYEVLNTLEGGLALVQTKPHSGRMHQIRVHLASIGHPIIGDKRYGTRESRKVSSPTHLLHAHKITFTHPDSGKKMGVTSPMPELFERR